MLMPAIHIDLFSAAAKLRFDASLKARIANFILRIFIAGFLVASMALSLTALAYGVTAFLKLIFQNIKIALA